ncbi:hypothetical protein C8J56DRAFT_900716 [Mycena floridula]|nr:hypothetical protein C8J56DRAFT_900716 [Mycena floridula]
MSIWTWLRNTIVILRTDGSSLPDMFKFSEIPVQMTVDGGSGTGKMYAMQVALREKYLAEYSVKESYMDKQIGYDIKNIFLLEKVNGYFNGAIELHVIQQYKKIPSGVLPETVFKFLQDYGLAHGGIKVEQEIVYVLRGTIPISRDECMRWVADEFNVAATAAFKSLKECPPFKAVNAGLSFYLR